MNGSEQSLLSYLDAPIVVGDPEGRAIYVNPAFESRFGEGSLGAPLAELFEGGSREAVLRAVATVCEQERSARFRIREGGVGFSAVASPIMAAGEGVGVVILFKEEFQGQEQLLAIYREIHGPVEEISSALETLFEETGGRRNPHHRVLVEDAQRGLQRLRKWVDEMEALVSGKSPSAVRSFDPAPALREIMRRSRRGPEFGPASLELLMPVTLPEVACDEGRFVEVLLRLVEARLDAETGLERLTLSGRTIAEGEERSVLIGMTEHGSGCDTTPFEDAPIDLEALASLGAERWSIVEPGLGRTTLLRFPL